MLTTARYVQREGVCVWVCLGGGGGGGGAGADTGFMKGGGTVYESFNAAGGSA